MSARGVLLGIAIAAAVAAAIPIMRYPFDRKWSWVDPYRNRYARWIVYLGGAVSLLLYIVLARD